MADHLTTLTYYQQLKFEDLAGLINLLRSHGYSGVNNYYDLGLYFGLTSPTLDVITRNNKDDVEGCLRECLNKWLQKVDDVQKKGSPTIYSLVLALKGLRENGVAERIQRQLDPACLALGCYISDESFTELLPQLAVILHAEGVIEKIKLPLNDPEQQTIKNALQKGVADNQQNLLKLVKVLQDNGAADIAAGIKKEYSIKSAKKHDDPDIPTTTAEQDNSTSTGLSTEAAAQSQLSLPPKDFSPMIFEDEIYGDIVIDHPLIVNIIRTSQFQRLRDIKQLGFIYQNVPKANYSRLQHSIGMFYLAGEYVKQLQRKQPELNITESDVLCVQIAALCFNLGHGPFSYTFDMLLDEMSAQSATADSKFKKPWKNVPEASVKMFEYMQNNEDLMASFEEHQLTTEDIAFIKELIQGVKFEKRKDKRFLYEIVYNKKSGLDVSMIDSTVRDAAVLGKNVTFRWSFLSKVHVFQFANGESHICFQKDDLETYNDLFRTRHTLFRELYYIRKNRIAALMIKRILAKSNQKYIIRYKDRRVTLLEATQSMLAYSQLNDGILSVIKILVDDPEVQELSSCLDSMKAIGQIGHIEPTIEWNVDRIKQCIEGSIKKDNIAGHLIIDPIKTGYENWNALTQYYYTSDGKTGQWTNEWAQPTQDASKSKIRIFLVSGDRDLIHEVQEALQKLISDEQLDGGIYPDQDNDNLMPLLQKQD